MGTPLRLVQTCGACPEQYDVFAGDRCVGYLRLRWGHFTAEYLPTGNLDDQAVLVYEHEYLDSLLGAFPDKAERKRHLAAAGAALVAKVEAR